MYIMIYESVRFRTPDHRTFAYKIACWSYVGLVFFSDFWEKTALKSTSEFSPIKLFSLHFFAPRKKTPDRWQLSLKFP